MTTPSQIVAASCIQLILRARTTVPVSDQLKKKVPGFWGSLAITRVQRRLPTLGVGPPELPSSLVICRFLSFMVCKSYSAQHNMPLSKHHQYDPISPPSLDGKDADAPYSDQNSEDEPFLETNQPVRLSRLRCSLPWILCAVFATTSAVLAFLLFQHPRSKLGQGYINDFSKPFKNILKPSESWLMIRS